MGKENKQVGYKQFFNLAIQQLQQLACVLLLPFGWQTNQRLLQQ
jgi:hypothetical protein